LDFGLPDDVPADPDPLEPHPEHPTPLDLVVRLTRSERETRVSGWPTFGGPEPSELLDAGQWLDVADRAAAEVPTDPAEASRVLAVARAAVDEVVKFVPAGQDAVPEDAFWTPEGQAVRDADAGRFRLDRLLAVRDRYDDLVRDTGAR